MNALYYLFTVILLSHITLPGGNVGSIELVASLIIGYLLWLAKSIVEAGYLAASGIDMDISVADAIRAIKRYIIALALTSLILIIIGSLGIIRGSSWIVEISILGALAVSIVLKLGYLPCLIYAESMKIDGCTGDAIWRGIVNVALPIIIGVLTGFLADLPFEAIAGSPLVPSFIDPLPGGSIEPWRSSVGEILGVFVAAKLIAWRIG